MNSKTTAKSQENDMLSEILLPPSNVIKTNRFTEENQAAACDGDCQPGRCHI